MRHLYIKKVWNEVSRVLPLYLLLLPLLVACDHIDENDRLIEVKASGAGDDNTNTVARNVLLEDFTGQNCVFCPKANTTIEQLEKAFGERLVAVGIHGGDLGFSGNDKYVGLATAWGNRYYDLWKIDYSPAGLINRRGGDQTFTDWMTVVSKEMDTKSIMKMTATATMSNNRIDITVDEQALADFTGLLQVWVLEDNITALQVMPDGEVNYDYVHNHVLRTPVNGLRGDALTIGSGEQKTQTLTVDIDNKWKTANLSVVAIAYNDKGVEQCTKTHVK